MRRKKKRKSPHNNRAVRRLPEAALREAAKRLALGLESVSEGWDSDDPESIEEAVFEAVSSVLKDKAIEIQEDRDAGLGSLMEILFGAESDLSVAAGRFGNLINGYFGDVDPDDMEEAQSVLDDIVSGLRNYIREHETRPPLFENSGIED